MKTVQLYPGDAYDVKVDGQTVTRVECLDPEEDEFPHDTQVMRNACDPSVAVLCDADRWPIWQGTVEDALHDERVGVGLYDQIKEVLAQPAAPAPSCAEPEEFPADTVVLRETAGGFRLIDSGGNALWSGLINDAIAEERISADLFDRILEVAEEFGDFERAIDNIPTRKTHLTVGDVRAALRALYDAMGLPFTPVKGNEYPDDLPVIPEAIRCEVSCLPVEGGS